MILAGSVGALPAGMTYRQQCGLYFGRHHVQEQRTRVLAEAIRRATGGGHE